MEVLASFEVSGANHPMRVSAATRRVLSFLPSTKTLELRLAHQQRQQQPRLPTHPSRPAEPQKPTDFPRNSLARREDSAAIRPIHIDRNARILPARPMSKSEICAQNRLQTMLGAVAAALESELGVLKTLVSSLLDGLEQNIACHDHEEFEQLLESFSKYVEEIVHEGTSTLTNIKSTEEIIDLILDSNRNTLLALDLKVSIGTMGLGVGALTAGASLPPALARAATDLRAHVLLLVVLLETGLFGMNLRTHLEAHPSAFYVVTGATLAGVALTIGAGWRRLYRLRRVGLSSSPAAAGSLHRISWGPPKHLPPVAPAHPSAGAAHNGGILDWDVPRNSPSSHH
ncbi:hypothetical protein PtB15_3B462 [Puccinia triticina]|nr:hypothetical protein PtB15_3B462 [Puccinia triticina]